MSSRWTSLNAKCSNCLAVDTSVLSNCEPIESAFKASRKYSANNPAQPGFRPHPLIFDRVLEIQLAAFLPVDSDWSVTV